MTKPKLNQLEMLVAVADEGSFGGAAAALDCTQSRISHGITELENTLGQRLLHRSRSGCTPTDAGHRGWPRHAKFCVWPPAWGMKRVGRRPLAAICGWPASAV